MPVVTFRQVNLYNASISPDLFAYFIQNGVRISGNTTTAVIRMPGDDDTLVLNGSGLVFTSDGYLSGGTIQSMVLRDGISGATAQVTQVSAAGGLNWSGAAVAAADTETEFNALFASWQIRLDARAAVSTAPNNTTLEVYGWSGNDTLIGSPYSDTLYGDAGNDWLESGAGNDYLYGGAGNDTLIGGSGVDYLNGDVGNDTYFLYGNTTTTIADSAGLDTIYSRIGRNLASFPTIERLFLQEGTSNYALTGNTLDNSLRGNAGNNVMNGGVGNDALEGGLGRDIMTGGDGVDYFVYRSAAESPGSSTACDVITDFREGGDDRINLAAVSSATLTYIGVSSGFTGANQVRVAQSGTATYVAVNLDGNAATAEMLIRLDDTTATNLRSIDFVL